MKQLDRDVKSSRFLTKPALIVQPIIINVSGKIKVLAEPSWPNHHQALCHVTYYKKQIKQTPMDISGQRRNR